MLYPDLLYHTLVHFYWPRHYFSNVKTHCKIARVNEPFLNLVQGILRPGKTLQCRLGLALLLVYKSNLIVLNLTQVHHWLRYCCCPKVALFSCHFLSLPLPAVVTRLKPLTSGCRDECSTTVLLPLGHDQNPSKSKSLSHLKKFYSRLTPLISRLLIINTMIPAC